MHNVLVYNDCFFEISQTFVYHQIEALTDHYNVDLLAHDFENPHNFDVDKYNKYKLSKPKNFIGKVTSKIYRLATNSTLHLDLKSHVKLNKIFRTENYQVIHAHFGYNGLNILHYAKIFNIPLVVTFHGHDASAMLSNKSYSKRLPELFDYASGINLVSKHMIDTLSVDPWIDKVHIIPCAVDPNEFNSSKSKSTSDNIRIVHAGRIAPKKGVPDLIKVFAKLTQFNKNLELHIAGDGEELEDCKQLAETLQISDQTVFYGAVSHDKLKSILATSDIFVLNSRVANDGDMEGTPVTLLEAMCMGKAVVSTYHAGIPDVVDHGVNGLLAEEKNNDQLQECLAKFILSSELRLKLGREAEKTIYRSYTIEKMKDRIGTLFTGITKSDHSNSVNKSTTLNHQKVS